VIDTFLSLIQVFIALAFCAFVNILPERIQYIIGIILTTLCAANSFVPMMMIHKVIPLFLYLGILCLLGLAGFTKALIDYNKKEERRKMMDASFSSNSKAD
jgi:hypothetical protein